MSYGLTITILVENTARRRGLLGEHGFACWIDTGTHRLLFDTGQGETLAANAGRLRINLASANVIVLSHGHYDHSGGLRLALDVARSSKLFLHPGALARRYSRHNGQAREIGPAPLLGRQLLQDENRLVWTTRPTEIVPGVFATGEIPRHTDYEDTGGEFFLDAACHEPDPIIDDQALYMDTESGIVVILGCAHAGIVNTLDYISQITHRPIHAVIGGTHLINASPQRLARTIAALRHMNLQIIAPVHCTGPRAMAALWMAFPDQITDGPVGTRWKFATNPERKL